MVVDGPITVTHTVTAGGAAVFPRLVIDAGADSEVTVIERFLSPDNVSALVVPVLHVRAQQAARVKYLAVNELGVDTWQIGNQQAIGERDSTIMLATVALGGDYARVRTEARVSGAGASTRQVALYFAGGSQMHDFRTIQDHDAPHTTSDLLFKGAVQDTPRSVYTGLIKIREHAGGSVAFQTNRNLTLSKGAWAESVPNLDIRTNDVKCSHASTVGPIDEEQRFYLESRGIEPSVAERLVVLGFFDEVLQQLPSGSLADELRRRVAAKLVIGSPAEVGRVSSTVVCSFDELAPGTARRFEIDGVAVAVVRIDDDVYAIGDVCSHANVSLSDGEVWCDEREIECPKHGSTFDLDHRSTGHAARHPTGAGVRRQRRRRQHRREHHARLRRHQQCLPRCGGPVTTLSIAGLRAAVGGKEILRGIDLEVSSGEVHAVMGPNGAGKSTLAAIVVGKPGYEVLDGSVTLDGRDLLSMPAWERAVAGLHLVMQYPTEVPGVTLVDAMAEALKSRGRETVGPRSGAAR